MKRIVLALAALPWLIGCPLPVEEHTTAGTGKVLSGFSIVSPASAGSIDQAAGTIRVTLPAGSIVTSLVASFTTTGTSVRVGDVKQVSGQTANDFTLPVQYVVVAQDGSMTRYTVTVSVAMAPSSEKALRSFSLLLPAATGVIDLDAKTVTVSVPHGTDAASLIAVFETTGVRVSVDDTEQTSGVTINDFTDPLTYLVTAEDGSTESWVVRVRALPGTEKELTGFGFRGVTATVSFDAQARVLRVRVPPGTDLRALTAFFTSTGAAVLVDGREQVSGITVNDFTRAVEYTVRAEDGSTDTWNVRVSAAIGLLINELDVDQVGIDNAEFIEVYATAEVDCVGIVLALINGGETPGQEYARIDLSSMGTLAAGSWLVVAGSRVSVAAMARKLTPAGWELTNRIQNGPNDAVLLFDTIGKRVIDAVSYNGVLHRALLAGETAELDATEGAAGAPADSNSVVGSISRIPSGRDTGQNGADFSFSPTPTPGAANN